MGEFAQALKRGLDIKLSLLNQGIPLGSTKFNQEFDKLFLSGADVGAPAAAPAGSPPGAAAPQQGGPLPAGTYNWSPDGNLTPTQ